MASPRSQCQRDCWNDECCPCRNLHGQGCGISREAEKAHSAAEKDHWLKIADYWAALALEVNPSGALPWDIPGG
jgi:hypothetical protein